MYVRNFKLNGKMIFKIVFVILTILIFIMFGIGVINIINSNEIMEDHYDSTLILEILDKDENKLYTFYDLLYSTCNTLNDANNNYDKLYSIIHASDNEEDIINSTNMLFRGGWTNVKLYFMIGLPTETKNHRADSDGAPRGAIRYR